MIGGRIERRVEMKKPVERMKRKRFTNECDKVTKPGRADPISSTTQQFNNKFLTEIDQLLIFNRFSIAYSAGTKNYEIIFDKSQRNIE